MYLNTQIIEPLPRVDHSEVKLDKLVVFVCFFVIMIINDVI